MLPKCNSDYFAKYVEERPDKEYFLSFIGRASALVCDCNPKGCKCHATYLSKILMSDETSNHVDVYVNKCDEDLEDSPDAIFVPETGAISGDQLQELNETVRGAAPDSTWKSNVGYCKSWDKLIKVIRESPVLLFWEIFAGCAVLTSKMRESGWHCAPPLDILYDSSFNLLNPAFLCVVIGLILEGRFSLIHLAPPCSSFSMAVNRFASYAMRSGEFPAGIPGLQTHNQIKVDLGNSLAKVSLMLAQMQEKAGHLWQWEQPARSIMLLLPDVKAFISRAGIFQAFAWMCSWGAPWAKPTVVIANHQAVMGIHRGCAPFAHEHFPLTGHAPDGRNWTAIAGPYWTPFAVDWANCWSCILDGNSIVKTLHTAGWAHLCTGNSLEDTVKGSGFVPGGKRDIQVIAKRVATGLQPVKRALPTLLPEGLGEDNHLEMALMIPHPFTLPVPVSQPCKYALDFQKNCTYDLNNARNSISAVISLLSKACKSDSLSVLKFIHPLILSIIQPRNCAFMREISWISAFPDLNFLPHYLFGFDTVGWAMHSPTAVPRVKKPIRPISEIWDGLTEHNESIMRRVKSTGDDKLDHASWMKSEAEFLSGSLKGPFYSLVDIAEALSIPVTWLRLLLRFPIWEQHGGAEDATCRNIDNGLQGGQNDFIGLQFTTRPADIDAIMALVRAVMEYFPGVNLRGTTSDFKSAYRQASANPLQAMFWIVAMFDPVKQKPCFAIAGAQLFGSSSAPLNFCRIPDWCTHVSSKLFAIAFISCIDDLIFVEQDNFAESAFRAWRNFADCCGWQIPDDKSPPPAFFFRALGAMVHLRNDELHKPYICVTEDRASKMMDAMDGILSDEALGPAYAGQLFGQLGFTCTQCHGKWGRAKMRPFVRRQYEVARFALNPQLMSAIFWWKSNIPRAPSRQVFVNDKSRHLVITYSDGEGADAGVGIAAWCRERIGDRPWASFIEVPREVRELWQSQKLSATQCVKTNPDVEFTDIIEVEAVGPLLILHNWGHLLQDSLWIHFIDNASALGALVKGSASVNQQDIIVGHTWTYIADLNVLAWFDRVDSKSNPVDGLSRKDFSKGKLRNWFWKGITFPNQVLNDLKAASKAKLSKTS